MEYPRPERLDDRFVDVTVPLVVTARRQFADMGVEILVSRQREVGRRAAPQLALVHWMRAEVLEGHALIQVFLAEFLALARLIDGAFAHVPHLCSIVIASAVGLRHCEPHRGRSNLA